jgi:hypothetical protein
MSCIASTLIRAILIILSSHPTQFAEKLDAFGQPQYAPLQPVYVHVFVDHILLTTVDCSHLAYGSAVQVRQSALHAVPLRHALVSELPESFDEHDANVFGVQLRWATHKVVVGFPDEQLRRELVDAVAAAMKHGAQA